MLAITGLLNQFKQPDHAKSKDGDAKQHSEHTLDAVKDAGVPIVRRREPPPPNPKPERNEWRQERDLQAQWEMARWAQYAAGAAIATVGVTLIGVWLLKRTLDATRDTLEEARKATKATERAVDVHLRTEAPVLVIRNMEPKRTPFNGAIAFDIENMGRTPAILHILDAKCVVSVKPPDQALKTDRMSLGETVINAGKHHPTLAFVYGKNRIDEALDGKAESYFWGTILYEDIFGQKRLRGFGYKGRGTRRTTLDITLGKPANEKLYWTRFGGDDLNYDEGEEET